MKTVNHGFHGFHGFLKRMEEDYLMEKPVCHREERCLRRSDLRPPDVKGDCLHSDYTDCHRICKEHARSATLATKRLPCPDRRRLFHSDFVKVESDNCHREERCWRRSDLPSVRKDDCHREERCLRRSDLTSEQEGDCFTPFAMTIIVIARSDFGDEAISPPVAKEECNHEISQISRMSKNGLICICWSMAAGVR